MNRIYNKFIITTCLSTFVTTTSYNNENNININNLNNKNKLLTQLKLKEIDSPIHTINNNDNNKFNNIVLMPGSTCKKLTDEISTLLGCEQVSVKTRRFSDGETLVVLDSTVRGKHVYCVQTCAAPLSDNIVELLQMVSTARNSGADRVTAIIPYFGYKFPKYIIIYNNI